MPCILRYFGFYRYRLTLFEHSCYICGMLFLQGEQAVDAIEQLHAQHSAWLYLAFDSQDCAPMRKPQLIAVASPHAVVLTEPQTLSMLRIPLRFCTFKAKDVMHALTGQMLDVQHRFGCLYLYEQLLCGHHVTSEQMHARYGVTTRVPNAMAEFGSWAMAWAKVAQTQFQRLKALELMQVARLESAALPAVVKLEKNGLPFDEAYAQQVCADMHAPEALRKTMRTYCEHTQGTGRLRATFEQIGASTGRMACRAPNLQAVDGNALMRQVFRPEAERVLVRADYAACELRILAQLSQEPLLLQAFERNVDLHAWVAQHVWPSITSEHELAVARDRAKAIQFGLIYGMSATGLAQRLQCSESNAQAWMQRYFQMFPRVQAYLHHVEQRALKGESLRSLGGRLLYIDSENDEFRFKRLARNMPIQATGADMMKHAMGLFEQGYGTQSTSVMLIHTIHDELMLEVPQAEAALWCERLQEMMLQASRALLPSVQPRVDASVAWMWDG